MSDSVFTVGTTAAQIDLPPLPSVLVINTSEGIGDNQADAALIVVNNSSACSIDPQVGIALGPGQSAELPLIHPSNDAHLPLFAIASRADAQLTVVLFGDPRDARC